MFQRLIEKSRATCIKWIPGSPNYFLVSYASGSLYVYNHELACFPTAPSYQLFKSGPGFTISTCKTKSTRNPLYKWSVGSGAVNEFKFSPCGHFLAIASQDGHLRVFNFDAMEPLGTFKSYFGGLTCVAWSPDGKYLVTGGEDDLITVYSFHDRRVVVRGQGHKSWVNQVAFDAYNMSYGEVPDGLDFSGSDEEGEMALPPPRRDSSPAIRDPNDLDSVTCYRVGSIGEDSNICLWDVTEETLKRASGHQSGVSATDGGQASSSAGAKSNSSSLERKTGSNPHNTSSSSKDSGLGASTAGDNASTGSSVASAGGGSKEPSSLSARLAALSFSSSDSKSKEHKRNFSFGSNSGSILGGSKGSKSGSNPGSNSGTLRGHGQSGIQAENIAIGTPQCPRFKDIPVIEPIVMKKIAHERLTALVFKEECLVTACQDGYVCTWGRPGRLGVNTFTEVVLNPLTYL